MTNSNWPTCKLPKKDSGINKNFAITIFIALSLLIACIILNKATYQFSAYTADLSLALNFILLVSIIFSFYYNNAERSKNISQERALKIISKIGRLKFSILNIDDLVKLICLQLSEDFKGKFWLILAENYQDVEIDEFYKSQVQHVLESMRPITTLRKDKIIYFQPMFLHEKKVGVLIAEVKDENDFTLTLNYL